MKPLLCLLCVFFFGCATVRPSLPSPSPSSSSSVVPSQSSTPMPSPLPPALPPSKGGVVCITEKQAQALWKERQRLKAWPLRCEKRVEDEAARWKAHKDAERRRDIALAVSLSVATGALLGFLFGRLVK